MKTLHEIIEERGLKLKKVCEFLGITDQTLRNIKKGLPVSAKTAKKVEKFTNGEVKLKIRYRGKKKKVDSN